MKLVTIDLLRVFLENLKTNFIAPRSKMAEFPEGFSDRSGTSSFGNQDGTCLTEWRSAYGAGIAFRENEGNVNVVTSGHFYSGNGENIVLDSENYKKYLPIGDAESGQEDSSSAWNINISGKAAKAAHADIAEKAKNAVNDDLGRKISDTYVSMAGGAINGDLHVTGDIYANRVHNAIYNDYAEYFEKGEDGIEPGDIVALDTSSGKEQYVKAKSDSMVIVGVCSDEYGHVIGGTPSKRVNELYYIPVALMGRVHVKVTGKVLPGQRIVISDAPGVGMAEDRTHHGQVLGIALTGNDGGRGKVRMLVNRR